MSQLHEIIEQAIQAYEGGELDRGEQLFKQVRLHSIERAPAGDQRAFRTLLQTRNLYWHEIQALRKEWASTGSFWDELEFSSLEENGGDPVDFATLEDDGSVPESLRFQAFRLEVSKAYGDSTIDIPFPALFDTKHHGYTVFQYEKAPEEALSELVRLYNSSGMFTMDADQISYEPTTPLQNSVEVSLEDE